MEAKEIEKIAAKTAEILSKQAANKQAVEEKVAAEKGDAFELGLHMYMDDVKMAEEHRPVFLETVAGVIKEEFSSGF